MKGKLIIWSLAIIAAMAIVAVAWACMPQVTLCHATSSPTNPFNEITVDASGAFNGHAGHGNDIIPSFTYTVNEQIGVEHRDIYHWSSYRPGPCHLGWSCRNERPVMGNVEHTYPGQNLGTLYGDGWTGAEVLANGCVVPPPHYTPCTDTTELAPITGEITATYGPYSAWADNGDGFFTRTRVRTDAWTVTYPVVDARDANVSCGQRVVPMSEDFTEFETMPGTDTVSTSADCDGWSAIRYTFNPDQVQINQEELSGVWSDPFALESAAAFGRTINEPEECLRLHGVQVGRDVDCVGAQGWYALDDSNPVVYDTIAWADQYEIEQTFLAPFDIELPWGGTAHIDGFQVDEPTDCLVACELTPLYFQYVLQDFDAPAGYLQGGTCYIISNLPPSVEDQARICTYPFCGTGWTFHADRVPYGGYVYRDCHGNIVYGWGPWLDSWLRTDFNLEGRTSPRLPACEDTGC